MALQMSDVTVPSPVGGARGGLVPVLSVDWITAWKTSQMLGVESSSVLPVSLNSDCSFKRIKYFLPGSVCCLTIKD